MGGGLRICFSFSDHSLIMGGCAVVSGRGHASICTGLRGALKNFEGKCGGGGSCNIFQRLFKNRSPRPMKNEWSLKLIERPGYNLQIIFY